MVPPSDRVGSLRVALSHRHPPALFCEFDKQFDKRTLTRTFSVLNKHQDTRIASFQNVKCLRNTERLLSRDVLPVYREHRIKRSLSRQHAAPYTAH